MCILSQQSDWEDQVGRGGIEGIGKETRGQLFLAVVLWHWAAHQTVPPMKTGLRCKSKTQHRTCYRVDADPTYTEWMSHWCCLGSGGTEEEGIAAQKSWAGPSFGKSLLWEMYLSTIECTECFLIKRITRECVQTSESFKESSSPQVILNYDKIHLLTH